MYPLQDWHWFLAGMLLITFEIFVPSFTIFWFGLAAVIVSLLLWIMPDLSIAAQFSSWIVLSFFIMFAWFKWIKPLSHNHTTAGLARENTIGQVGMVINRMPAHNEVTVRFPIPLMGSDEWTCHCMTVLQTGDRVQVTDILGNKFLVVAYSTLPTTSDPSNSAPSN